MTDVDTLVRSTLPGTKFADILYWYTNIRWEYQSLTYIAQTDSNLVKQVIYRFSNGVYIAEASLHILSGSARIKWGMPSITMLGNWQSSDYCDGALMYANMLDALRADKVLGL